MGVKKDICVGSRGQLLRQRCSEGGYEREKELRWAAIWSLILALSTCTMAQYLGLTCSCIMKDNLITPSLLAALLISPQTGADVPAPSPQSYHTRGLSYKIVPKHHKTFSCKLNLARLTGGARKEVRDYLFRGLTMLGVFSNSTV